MNQLIRKPLAIAIAALALPTDSLAQIKEQANEVIEEELIVVGYRKSLQNAIETKQRSAVFVESVYATDIGKLPDSSIAESIARLPGVAAQRLDGRASAITIRGLGEDFNPVTINGREQVSLNDNRGVEFDVYPSEIVNQVVVYKTPEARLINQGIGGTVELRTINPLDLDDLTFSVNAKVEQNEIGQLNPDGKDNGARFSAAYIDQFADDTIGVALTYASLESPNNEERWSAWEWVDNGNGNFVLGGAKPFVRSSVLQRDTIAGVLQFQPTDNFSATFDFLTIDFEDEKILRGIEIPAYSDNNANDGITVLETRDGGENQLGVVTQGVINNAEVLLRNDYEVREATLDSFGINLELKPTDAWTLEVDFSHANVMREIFSLESYTGTGRGYSNGETTDLLFEVNNNQEGVVFAPGTYDSESEMFFIDRDFYGSYDRFQLGGPLSWAGEHPLAYQNRDGGPQCPEFTDNRCYRNNAQDGFFNTPEIEDELTTFRMSGELAFEDGLFSSIEFGINHNVRTKSKVDKGVYLTLPGFYANLDEFEAARTSGSLEDAIDVAEFDNDYQTEVPEAYRLGTVSLEFLGLGDMIAYDSYRFYQDGGYYSEINEIASDGQPARAANTWVVDESVTTLYGQANIDSYMGSATVKGNVGLQIVRTDQSSDGYQAQLNNNGSIDVTPSSGGITYEDILPSANLAVEYAEGQQVRFGYARTLVRSRMDRLNASFGYGRNFFGNHVGGGGNPALRPYLANQLDLGYEWYFTDQGYLSASTFFKQLDQWQIQVRDDELSGRAYNALIESGQQVNFVDLTKWETTAGGTIQGAEFTVSLPGHLAHDVLDGFGIVGSGTFLSSEIIVNGNRQVVPGLSDEIYNMTFYYENYGFEFRASLRKRSDFLGEVSDISFTRRATTILGSEIWDAQVSYDFSEMGVDGLSVSLQMQNVTDEPFVTINNDDLTQVKDYQRYGQNVLLGVSYKY